MATITSNNIVTYGDWLKAIGPDERIMAVVQLLNQENTVMQDMSYVEGNGIAAHLTTQQAVLPTNSYRDLNEATTPTKALTQQVWDVTAMMEAWAALDLKLWELQGDGNKFRAIQDRARLESMSQDMASGVFYNNNDVYPKRFHGLSPRYNASTGTYGSQILKGDGTGSDDCYSVWVVDWDESTISGFYPKGSKAGFQYKDYGEQPTGSNSAGYQAQLLTRYNWDMGLYVADYRYAARLANLKASDIAAGTDLTAHGGLVKALIKLVNLLPPMHRGNRVMYAHRDVISFLETLLVGGTAFTSNVRLTIDNYAGQRAQFFRDIPLRRCDALVGTEAVIA